MRRFDAVVVGLGNIGLRYDLEATDGGRVASHARAFATHPGYRLVGGVDPTADGRALFETHYGVPAFADVGGLAAAGIRPEVWSVAVPTHLHSATFDEIIALRPTAILCEKPLAESLADGGRMVAAAAGNGCVLAVNYMRRFEPGVLALRRLIAGGALGEIYKGSAWYSKGLLNNGSHVIDLLSFLLGPAGSIQLLAPGRRWEGRDPEPDICLNFGAARIVMLSAREECFSHIGFEIVGAGGTVRYTDSGHRIEVRRAQPAPGLPGYHILGPEVEVLQTDLKRYQWHAVDALHRHLDSGEPLNSTGASALETLRAVDMVREALDKPQESGKQHD